MSRLLLHLDADASQKALELGLRRRGHDVTRTPCDWMAFDALDEAQLLGAAAQGRCIFSFNVKDFALLAERYPDHRGVLLANRCSWRLGALVHALDGFLSTVSAEEMCGQLRWLPRLDPDPNS